MAKSHCTLFPNCSSLAKKFEVGAETLNAYINVYNLYASAEDKISPDVKYTEEQLEEIYNKISKQRETRKTDTKYQNKERAEREKFVGGPEAYALQQVSEVFTGGEIEGITSEISRMFINAIEDVRAKFGGASVEDAIKRFGMNFFIERVMRTYKGAYNATIPALDIYQSEKAAGKDVKLVPVPGLYNTVQEATATYKYLKKLLPADMQGNLNMQLLHSMIVMSLKSINQMLNINIKADFSVDTDSGIAYELAESVRDMEEPQQEHWNKILDSETFEGTISSIVNRVLMAVSKTKLVTEVHMEELPNGEVMAVPDTHTEIERSPIFRKPLLSNPAVVARRLFSSLAGITDESSLLAVIGNSEEYKELAEELAANPRLRTTFFQEFNKYLQVCRGTTTEMTVEGTINSQVTPLNIGSRTDGFQTYKSRVRTGRLSSNSFFDYKKDERTGKYVPTLKSYKEFYKGIYNWFNITFVNKDSEGKTLFEKSDVTQQEGLLAAALDFINIPATSKALGEILFDSSKKAAFISEVKSFLDIVNSFGTGNWSIFKLFNSTDFKESTGVIMSLLGVNPKSAYRSQVSYAGSTLSSMILNSPLSILAKKVNRFYDTSVTVDGVTHEITNLSDYLKSRYLNSPQFVLNGRILNRWLADFLACGGDVRPNAKSIFGFVRDLGIDDIKFEDITEEQHMAMSVFGYLKGRDWGSNSEAISTIKLVASEREIDPKDNNSRQIILGTPYMFYKGQKVPRTDPSFIRSFITGDTNALRQIRTIHYYEPEILDGVYNLFLADLQTQNVIRRFNELGFVFYANGKETFVSHSGRDSKGNKIRISNENSFGILKFLNEKHTDNETWYDYFVNKSAQRLGFDAKPLTQEQLTTIQADEDTFKEVAREYFSEKLKVFKDELAAMGYLDKTEDGKYIYFNEFIRSSSENPEADLDAVLLDYLLNYKFSQYNQAHVFHVSPLFFLGVEDMQKRNKGVLTNGYALSMQAMDSDGNYVWDYDSQTNSFDFTSKVVYFKDFKVKMDDASRNALIEYYSKFMPKDKAEELIDEAFSENTLTDGQAYRTFESYRKVLLSAGLSFWSERQEAAYKKIMSLIAPIRAARRQGKDANLTIEQIQEIEDLMVEFQPIKPINDGIETFGDENFKIGFQFKYAEVPLIPELLPAGSALRELAEVMVDRGIDMMASDKCLKKGSFGEMDLQYKKINGKYVDAKGNILPGMDANGKIIDDGTQTSYQQLANPENHKNKRFVMWEEGTSVKQIFDAHKVSDEDQGFVTHIIPMENYLIQSNIPDHTDGNSILGTQPRKIGTGAIKKEVTYSVGTDKQQVDGEQLARLYGAAHAAKYMKSFGKFMGRISNISDIVSDLVYQTINSGRGNLATVQRLILADGMNPTVPFGEPSNSRDINSSIISIFKKTVIRQLISGGSLVQASSLGCGKKALGDTGLHAVFKEVEEVKENGEVVKHKIPIGMQTEMPFDFHFTDQEGNMLPLRYEDYCDENGYFLDENGEAIKEDRYDTAKPKIEIDFPGILDLVAYRIPTEMEYSMFHLRIVKCNPKNAGNTIKLPAECTSIAGFDFDIDKLFLMRHNFSVPKGVDVSAEEVWESFYNKNKAFRDLLGAEWEKEGKPDKRWHTYWYQAIEQNAFFHDEYKDKDAIFNRERARLLAKHIDKTPIDFNMDASDAINLSQKQLDNLIVDCTIALLSDETTLRDRYTPGGFTGASLSAKTMRLLEAGMWNSKEESFSQFLGRVDKMEDYKPEYDYSDPMTSIIFKEMNQVAGTLIGIFANDSINNFISQGLAEFKITDPSYRILFGSLLDEVTELDGNTKDIDKSDIGYSFLHKTVNDTSIKRTLAELLAAAVDAVKDPVLNYLNLNSITADAAAMLARLGYTTTDIGLLLNQPIVKEVCKYMNRSGVNNVTQAIVDVLKSKGVENAEKLIKPGRVFDSNKLTASALAMNLNPSTPLDIKSQIAVAQLFNTVMQVKGEFSNFVQKTRNTSANTVKSTFEAYLSSEQKGDRDFSLLSIKTKEGNFPIDANITLEDLSSPETMKALLEKYKDHPFIYEQIVYNLIRIGMQQMMDKFTLYTTPIYDGYRNQLKELVAPWGLGEEQIEELHADIPTILISSLAGDFNPLQLSDNGLPNAVRYLDMENENGFISQLYSWLPTHPEEVEGPLFSVIDAEEVGNNKMRLKATFPRSISEAEKFAITLAWDRLMKQGGVASEIAKGLYLHFYYSYGLNPKSNRLMELAPVSVLKALKADGDLNYIDFFDSGNAAYETADSSPDTILTMKKNLYQFILTHNDDSKLVRNVSAKLSGNKNYITFSKAGENNLSKVTIKKKMKGKQVIGVYFAPIIKIDGNLYVLSTLSPNGYSIDYDNIKSASTDHVTYVAVTEESLRDDSAAYLSVFNRLFGYFNNNNGLIFKYSKSAMSVEKVLSSDDIITDIPTSDSVGDAYDDAAKRTKDEKVQSSDGLEQC